jgi:poly-gamma-glutamate capsule biosynthesis protein CapA/YwtB (metallophosphatase superfamily)
VVTLFLCGDVMTGRGVDQLFSHASDPQLHEPYVDSATYYIHIAERCTGPIPRQVEPGYVWGDALEVLERFQPEARIINLETSVTRSDDWWQGKSVHYRMHPANADCLKAAHIDCCVLANNHVLDWGRQGLAETLEVLRAAGVQVAGAGMDLSRAEAPAILETAHNGRVLVYGFGARSSGIPEDWDAERDRPGVNLLPDFSRQTVDHVARHVRETKKPGDVVVASIHWGENWNFRIPEDQQGFARALIDEAGVDLVHGHSSHHVKGMEVYGGKLILYGCGDLLTDYEGIDSYREFRGDLGLMYFPSLDPGDGHLERLLMVPTQVQHFRIQRTAEEDTRWLAAVINRMGKGFGTGVEITDTGELELRWR